MINSNNNNQLECVDVAFKKGEDEELRLVGQNRIQGLELKHSRLNHGDLKCDLNQVNELRFFKCTFDIFDHTVFDFCAEKLLKLEIDSLFASRLTKSAFKNRKHD